MKLTYTIAITLAAFSIAGFAAEKKIQMKDLPPAVQKAVEEQTKGATVKGISKEVENGKTMFEVETTVNGKGRDLILDPAGAVVEVEAEVTLDSIPTPAKAAIEKKAVGGKIIKVETLTKGKSITYEAAIKKGMKTSEVTVNADGSSTK